MSATDKYEVHEHDVIVIGAGGAGLRAAIEASAIRAIPSTTTWVCTTFFSTTWV